MRFASRHAAGAEAGRGPVRTHPGVNCLEIRCEAKGVLREHLALCARSLGFCAHGENARRSPTVVLRSPAQAAARPRRPGSPRRRLRRGPLTHRGNGGYAADALAAVTVSAEP